MNRVMAGCLAGFAATIPMTAAMVILHRRLPRRERDPLPPYHIIKSVSEKVGIARHLDEDDRRALTVAAHFAYGAATGGIYGLSAEAIPLPSAVRGSVYGLLVWGASYLKLLPSLQLYRSQEQEPPRRTALMIAAHLVWGSVLGALFDQLTDKIGAGHGCPPKPGLGRCKRGSADGSLSN